MSAGLAYRPREAPSWRGYAGGKLLSMSALQLPTGAGVCFGASWPTTMRRIKWKA
jgi:hypothetical protein